MPVDPQIQALLDKGSGVPATHTLPVAVERAEYEARIALMAAPAEIAAVSEETIAGPGDGLRLRIYALGRQIIGAVPSAPASQLRISGVVVSRRVV